MKVKTFMGKKWRKKKMKKTLIFMAALTVIGILACSEDKTELRWKNESSSAAKEIKWIPANGNPEVEWEETFAIDLSDGLPSSWKEIDDGSRTGQGEAFLINDGNTGFIVYDRNNPYETVITLSKGNSAEYSIIKTTASK
jgi:hypothetical protein